MHEYMYYYTRHNVVLTFPPLTGNTEPVAVAVVSFLDTGFPPTGGFGGLLDTGLGLDICG